uniref:Junctional adhesion molecule B-like n=1 Tax=Sinocyclocheilus anshuiensis TaxID=1608454 RepID=A0A671RU01_9TELE
MLQRRAAVVPVTVTSRSPGVEVHEFSDAELSCEFRTENDKNPRIEWKKIDKDVSFVYYDGRFVGNQRFVTVCVRLTLVPPHTPSCDVPSSALTGSLVQLRCRDRHSIPAAIYTWFKDNRALPIQLPNATYTIDEKTGVLTFQKVSRADAGQYYCEARNGVGPGKSCSGTRMQIDDLNEAALISGVLLLALLLFLCAFGGFYAHRHGLFSRESFWIPQCHGAAHISSQNLHRTEHM